MDQHCPGSEHMPGYRHDLGCSYWQRAGVGYSGHNGDFVFFSERKPWNDARNSCVESGGDLASIHSPQENQMIWNALPRGAHFDEGVWIGINDQVHEGRFKWSDETELNFANWNDGEPNNHGGEEDCGAFYEQLGWNDLPCGRPNPYICKFHQKTSTDSVCISPGGCDLGIKLGELDESTRSACNLEDQSDDLSITTTSLKFDKERRVLYGSVLLSNKKKISEVTGIAVVNADVVEGSNILFVRSVSQGRLSPGDELSGYGLPPFTRVDSFGTAKGGIGTYHTTSTFKGTFAGVTVTAVMKSTPEKYFLTAKVFNSKGRGSESKFRLGSGQFPLYDFSISYQTPENLTLEFQGVIPIEYKFKHIDSFKVKIKKGKMRAMTCAAYHTKLGALI